MTMNKAPEASASPTRMFWVWRQEKSFQLFIDLILCYDVPMAGLNMVVLVLMMAPGVALLVVLGGVAAEMRHVFVVWMV
jgi:hypothetical protein